MPTKKIRVSPELYSFLSKEAKIRNLTIGNYVQRLVDNLRHIQYHSQLINNNGNDLRDFFLENKIEFAEYLMRIRDIGLRKEHEYLSILSSKLIDIYGLEDLQDNLLEQYSDNYGRALKNLFNFMEFKGLDNFNNIPIERWKINVKLKPSNSDSDSNSFLSATKVDEI